LNWIWQWGSITGEAFDRGESTQARHSSGIFSKLDRTVCVCSDYTFLSAEATVLPDMPWLARANILEIDQFVYLRMSEDVMAALDT